MPSKFQGLLDKLEINEKFNKPIIKDKTFNQVKDNIPLIADANMMADILYLPEDKNGFKFLFVIVDLATDEFDIEPIKDKNPVTVLAAMKKCFKRSYIKKPEYSLKTDGGPEFKGVFHKYLYDESILHKTSMPYRHNSLANVESLNKQLGRLFNGYMNKQEEKTGKVFKDWTNVIATVRKDLNKYRKKVLPKHPEREVFATPNDYRTIETAKTVKQKNGKTKIETTKINSLIEPKYKVGQHVYRALDAPKNALGKNQNTKNFRMGDYTYDSEPREITQIFTMGGKGPLYRYYLDGLPNVSYTERQLMKVPALDLV
jgi:hypothetical protein